MGLGSDLVGEDDEVSLDTKIANGLKFGFGKDFSNGIVADLVSVHFWASSEEHYGVLRTIILVLELMAFSSASMFTVQSPAEDTSEPPFFGGSSGT